MKVRVSTLLLYAGLTLGLAVGSSATRADSPPPATAAFTAAVEGALGTDADEALRPLDLLAKAGAKGGLDATVVASTAVTLLSRGHWASAPRGLDVRVKAIEAIGECGLRAIPFADAVDRVVGAPDADSKLKLAWLAARERIETAGRAADDKGLRRQRITKSIDNVRTMLLYYAGAGAGVEKAWPPYGGKRFVLWLVAKNLIARSDEKQLSILFSPADESRGLIKAGGLKAFEKLTLPALRDPATDVSALTSYAGRRNDEKEHVLTAAEQVASAPILADLSFPGGVVLGYSGGAARWVSAEELGLPPGQPIVVGDASPNEMLKHLSDR